MDKELKRKWLQALRSGRYKQTTGRLRRDCDSNGKYTYCCLGVLCNIINRKGWENKLKFHYKNDSDNYNLPENLVFDLKLDIAKLEMIIKKNDGGSTFEEIAKIIEKDF